MGPISRKKVRIYKQNYRVDRKSWRANADAEFAGVMMVTEIGRRSTDSMGFKTLDSTNSKNSREMKFTKTGSYINMIRSLKYY